MLQHARTWIVTLSVVYREEMQQRSSVTVNSVAISCPDTRQDMIIEPSKPSDLAGNALFVDCFRIFTWQLPVILTARFLHLTSLLHVLYRQDYSFCTICIAPDLTTSISARHAYF